jgi:hypothetical protein
MCCRTIIAGGEKNDEQRARSASLEIVPLSDFVGIPNGQWDKVGDSCKEPTGQLVK